MVKEQRFYGGVVTVCLFYQNNAHLYSYKIWFCKWCKYNVSKYVESLGDEEKTTTHSDVTFFGWLPALNN